MKKLVMLFAGILLLSGPIYAQDESSGEGSSGGAGSGDVLIEFTANPIQGGGNGSSSILDFSNAGLRGRYVLSETLTPRLTVRMDLQNVQETPSYVTSVGEYDIRPGVEYSFFKDGNFKSYAAADIILNQRFVSQQSSTGPSYIGGTFADGVDPNVTTAMDRAFFGIGLGLSAGADYYFGKSRFYIGVEIGLDYKFQSNAEIFEDGTSVQTSTRSNFANVNLMNALRFGFKLL